jgi:hypothetical protein
VGFIFLTRKKGQVVLYPKRTRFCKYQKGIFKGCKADGIQLCFGKYGMKSCKAGRISYQAIEATRRIISKKSGPRLLCLQSSRLTIEETKLCSMISCPT